MSKDYQTLNDLYQDAVATYASNRLFGTKKGGSYQWITYAEFGELVDAFRGGLAARGIGKGDTVAIISNNRVEWAVAAYATYGIGAKFCPMYEAQLAKDWRYIIGDSGAKILLTANHEIYEETQPFREEFDSLEHIIFFDGPNDHEDSYARTLEVGRQSPVEVADVGRDDLCGFIYTSGTTGNPKGVLLSHYNICSNVNAIHAMLDIGPSDVSLSFLPWAHSFGQTVELHGLFSMGAALGLAESVQTIVQNLGEVKPTLLFSVPRIFNRIYDGVHKKIEADGGLKKTLFEAALENSDKLRAETEGGGSPGFMTKMKDNFFDKVVFSKIRERFGGRLRYAFSGGAALSPEVARFIDNLHITVYEGYGLTETSPIVSCNRPGARKIGSVGKPLENVEVILEPVEGYPEENVGEICVKGPNVMQGYHNLPEKTAEVIDDDGKFHTGDLGKLDEQGFLFIIGRVKEQYKLENGKYVVPAPLEEQLKLSPFINQVMIEGTNRPYNVALIVVDMETTEEWAAKHGMSVEEALDSDDYHQAMRDEIDRVGANFKGYEKPKKFALTTDEFTTENEMLTPSLKVKRRIVMDVYGDLIDSLYKDEAGSRAA
jgi:long-chain acyl-CoA synthetase